MDADVGRAGEARKLDGKIALITGGTSGIGLATAKRFVDEGAYVFITGRREPELAAAVKEIGRNVNGVQGDVSNLDDLDRLFSVRIRGASASTFAVSSACSASVGLGGGAVRLATGRPMARKNCSCPA